MVWISMANHFPRWTGPPEPAYIRWRRTFLMRTILDFHKKTRLFCTSAKRQIPTPPIPYISSSPFVRLYVYYYRDQSVPRLLWIYQLILFITVLMPTPRGCPATEIELPSRDRHNGSRDALRAINDTALVRLQGATNRHPRTWSANLMPAYSISPGENMSASGSCSCGGNQGVARTSGPSWAQTGAPLESAGSLMVARSPDFVARNLGRFLEVMV